MLQGGCCKETGHFLRAKTCQVPPVYNTSELRLLQSRAILHQYYSTGNDKPHLTAQANRLKKSQGYRPKESHAEEPSDNAAETGKERELRLELQN